ncbi:response regulator [Salinivibrio kushneri]|uniref:Response regulator n=1 Tax=Salinivibrio kushneri TaxID=1908198 RepID=A0AA47KNF1_9GAMM|nr:response regulator [Salinivibrio kushneri]WBA10180.1 response regulator [Salinivibrio kushneri]
MTTQILITDDSALARKQLARTLPNDLDADVHFAENGNVALDVLSSQPIDIMFLDLTMPELDGYQTLEAMQEAGMTVPVVVVSGDIQPLAQQQVLERGAKDFVKKPISRDRVEALIKAYLPKASTSEAVRTHGPKEKLSRRDIYMEVVNIAMGQAADKLARHCGVFVHMPLPQVNVFEVTELTMTIRHLAQSNTMNGVCQGFSGEGIAGEALMLISDSSITEMVKLLDYPEDGSVDNELELLVDISNILISAFLKGLGDQGALEFSQSYPALLGQHAEVDQLIAAMKGSWKRTVTIEVSYQIDGTDIKCDLLLLLLDESLPLLDAKLAYLMDEE